MTPPSAMKSGGQIGSLLASLFFICAGLITLYDTTSYTDRDSQVFPQTVAIILVVTASFSFIARFLKPSDEGGFGTGIWWRRALLIIAMFLMGFLIPKIGFLPAGVVAFSGGLIAVLCTPNAALNICFQLCIAFCSTFHLIPLFVFQQNIKYS